MRREYQEHLNPRSATKGRMVTAYGELIRRMWRDGASGSAERPSDVKAVVGKVCDAIDIVSGATVGPRTPAGLRTRMVNAGRVTLFRLRSARRARVSTVSIGRNTR